MNPQPVPPMTPGNGVGSKPGSRTLPPPAPQVDPAGHPDPRKARLFDATPTSDRPKTMIPAPDPADGPAYKGAPPRVTVVDRLYFSGGGHDARAVTAGYSFPVASDEQPYVRSARLKTADWARLDVGWLGGDWDGVSVACLKCTAGGVEVSLVPYFEASPAGSPAHLVVLEGETVRLRVALGIVPFVRPLPTDDQNPVPTAYTLTAFPK